jgi:hypothetical protein
MTIETSPSLCVINVVDFCDGGNTGVINTISIKLCVVMELRRCATFVKGVESTSVQSVLV